MKIAGPVLTLLAGALVCAGSGGVSGTWNTTPRPDSQLTKAVYEPTFEFRVDGHELTGVARITGWPRNGTISDGKVEGDRITFTLTHEDTYTISDPINGHRTFRATCRCAGTVHGDELDLNMISPNPGLGKFHMKGTKTHD